MLKESECLPQATNVNRTMEMVNTMYVYLLLAGDWKWKKSTIPRNWIASSNCKVLPSSRQ
jgi:hypothetical protein